MNRTLYEPIATASVNAYSTNATLAHTEHEFVIIAVGLTYILAATIFIPLHIACSYLMWNDKEMRNPTYQLIINLSIADVLELIPLGMYAGIVILMRLQTNEQINILHRIMAFLVMIAWYASCILFVLIAFSRWIAVTRSYLVQKIFTRRNLYLMHLVPWIVICLFYFCNLIPPLQYFSFDPEHFTWGFDMNLPFGVYLHWHNFVFNTLSAIVEMTFSILSLRWVHQTRKTIRNLTATKNQRREVKLLLQCFIIGCVFTFASLMFTVVFAAGLNSPMAYLGVQILWTFNHCVNPLVYLSVNTKLRRAFVRLVTCEKFCHYKKGKLRAVPNAMAACRSNEPLVSGPTASGMGDGRHRRAST